MVREPRLRWPVSHDLAQCITGQKITEVNRRAKYLLFVTDAGRMMLHLGMSGSLRVLPARVDPGKHDHVDIVFTDGSLLRFRDPRRFGSVFWLKDDRHVLLDSLGPEPLSDSFDGSRLFGRSRKRKVAIKPFIMNSKEVVGVGNIYANEALFRAGIRPGVAAGRLTRAACDRLAVCIKEVLGEAIEAGGTTLRDFVNESGNPGYFRHNLEVYGRGGEPCLKCDGELKETRLGQRTTVYCPVCQR